MSDLALPSPFHGAPQPVLSALSPTATSSGATAQQPGKLHKAAQDFEAIFLRQVLAEARKSTMGDTLFSNDANSTFTQMQDARVADIAASRDALGLAGMIERQLGGRSAAPGTSSMGANTGAARKGAGS